jgi:hypothetical protein
VIEFKETENFGLFLGINSVRSEQEQKIIAE